MSKKLKANKILDQKNVKSRKILVQKSVVEKIKVQ